MKIVDEITFFIYVNFVLQSSGNLIFKSGQAVVGNQRRNGRSYIHSPGPNGT